MTCPPPQSFLDCLDHHAAERAGVTAVGTVRGDRLEWLTWGELRQRVFERTEQLAALELGHGDRVLVGGKNSLDWIATDLALQRLGAVSVPVHASTTAAHLDEVARRSGAVLSIADAAIQRLARSAPAAEVNPELATLVFTSGTSGQPRGVMLTRANLFENASALSQAVGGDRSELRLSILPFSHMYARTCDLYAWLLRGSRLVIGGGRESLFRDLAVVRPTAINAVPYFYQKCIELAASAADAKASTGLRALLGGEVTRCFCGGAAVAPRVERTLADAGLPLLVGYGLTEASPVVTASTAQDHRPGAVGKPLPGVEVRLDTDGEVLVRGPSVMLGYWNDPLTTIEVLQEGWLRTGDLGRLAEGGFLEIVGRKKEQIALATGKKVAPAKIEALLCASPWIEQAAVVGEGRNCLGALLVPNPERVRSMVRSLGLWVWSKRAALQRPQIRQALADEIQKCLADCPPEEQVHAFELLGRAFSTERGEMTEKLSLRRAAIGLHFSREIETMFRRLKGTHTR